MDIITADGIREVLSKPLKSKLNITVKECSESTNNDVKALAREGAGEGRVVVACTQTEGKGRLGRSFFSPDGTGVYMSVLLRPEIKPEDATLITTAAAVSVCKALNKMGADNCGIKWVNDIYIDGRKVCGILAEAGFDADCNVDYIVLGVGLNVYAPYGGFPDDIKDIAGAVFSEEKENMRNIFAGEFLNSFFEFYGNIADRKHVQEYKKLCFLYGCEVDVVIGANVRRAKVLGLDDNCGLRVEYSNGESSVLTSGEVSLKVIK